MPKTACVIGAGAAGLNAARYSLEAGFRVTVYEQTNVLGGTWYYTDETGVDQNGLPIHTSMYTDLLTNLPKETMGFKDYPMPEQNISYVTQAEVLEFLHAYARQFNVADVIKYEHQVIRVTPHGDTQWEVIVRDFVSKLYTTEIFDFIFVCNGHYWNPYIPKIDGIENFTGSQIHSRSYRKVDPYRGEKLLIIGAGSSGVDIAKHIVPVAQSVTLSFHPKQLRFRTSYPDGVVYKPRIHRIHAGGIEFEDGTIERYTKLIFCTGYKYSFPFLSVDCEVATDGRYVRPVYKHIININRPTMAFIGLPFSVTAFPNFDIQCRFVVKFYAGGKELPSKEDMLEDTEHDMQDRWNRGYPKDKAHMMGARQDQYFIDLADAADIEPIKPVVLNIYHAHQPRFLGDLMNFQKDRYRILDDHNFERLDAAS